MYEYIVGKVSKIEANYLVLENRGIGYKIFTANPYSFELNKEYQIEIYQHLREDDETLFGFKTTAEKQMFLKLISVKGIGPKMTLPMLAVGTPEGIIDAIDRENIIYLKKFPKIGDKVARQIILDLKGKLAKVEKSPKAEVPSELYAALKGLGYKEKEVMRVMGHINNESPLESQIKEALKLLLK